MITRDEFEAEMDWREWYNLFIENHSLSEYEALQLAIQKERNQILRENPAGNKKHKQKQSEECILEEQLLIKHFRKPTFEECNDAEYMMLSEVLAHLQSLYKVSLKENKLREALVRHEWKFENKRVINKKLAKGTGDYGIVRKVYAMVVLI